MQNLQNYGVQELTPMEINETKGGNFIVNGLRLLAKCTVLLVIGFEQYKANNCNGGGCRPVGMSGSVSLGNTPYQF